MDTLKADSKLVGYGLIAHARSTELGDQALTLQIVRFAHALLPSRLRMTRTAVMVRPKHSAKSASGTLPSRLSCHGFQPVLAQRFCGGLLPHSRHSLPRLS